DQPRHRDGDRRLEGDARHPVLHAPQVRPVVSLGRVHLCDPRGVAVRGLHADGLRPVPAHEHLAPRSAADRAVRTAPDQRLATDSYCLAAARSFLMSVAHHSPSHSPSASSSAATPPFLSPFATSALPTSWSRSRFNVLFKTTHAFFT